MNTGSEGRADKDAPPRMPNAPLKCGIAHGSGTDGKWRGRLRDSGPGDEVYE